MNSSDFNRRVEIMLDQARSGRLGEPDSPDRSNSLHHAFWVGYFGHEIHKPNPGTTTYPAYKAGVKWRELA